MANALGALALGVVLGLAVNGLVALGFVIVDWWMWK